MKEQVIDIPINVVRIERTVNEGREAVSPWIAVSDIDETFTFTVSQAGDYWVTVAQDSETPIASQGPFHVITGDIIKLNKPGRFEARLA